MPATRIDVANGVTGWLDDVALGNGVIWVVTSAGLQAFGHPEIVLPVSAHPQLDRDATARTLGQILGAIARAAQAGQSVAAGGTTRFGAPVLGFDGVVYMPPAPIGAQHLPDTSLVGIFASASELDGVAVFGARRFASQLARQTQYFPYPPWTDVGRQRFAIGQWPSVISDMPYLGLPGATITRENGLHFRLGRAQAGAVLRSVMPQLPPATPPTFTLHAIARTANCCLVWEPNQQGAQAVAPPGSAGERMGGCFFATANQQPANSSQIVEDGFAYYLRDQDYAAFRAALESQTDVVIRGAQPGDDLHVTWVDDAAPAPQAASRVRIVGVQLLVEPKDGGAATAAYIKTLASVVERVMPAGAPYEMLVEVKPRAPITIATRPASPPQDVLTRCLAELGAVPVPRITGELGFQLHLAIDS